MIVPPCSPCVSLSFVSAEGRFSSCARTALNRERSFAYELAMTGPALRCLQLEASLYPPQFLHKVRRTL